MPRRPSLGRRRLSKHGPLAFSPFMRSLAFASTSRRRLPHPKDCQCFEEISFNEKFHALSNKQKENQLLESSDEEDSQGEISWATEDEPTKELRRSFRFKSYILVTKIYKLKNPKQKKTRRGEEDNEETIFLKPEDEIFLELGSWSFTFPMHSQLVTSQEMKSYQLMGLVMADKIPKFRQKLKSLIDEQ